MGDHADERKLFVGKLPQDVIDDEIRTIFNTYGSVIDVHLMDGRNPGQDRCCFVTYEDPESAKVAIQVLNGVYKFREDAPEAINVSIARPRGGGGKAPGGKGGRDDYYPPPHDGRGGYDRPPPFRGHDYDYGPKDRYDRGFYDRRDVYDRGFDRRYERDYDSRYDRGFDPRFDYRDFDPRYDRGYDRYDRGYDRGYDPYFGGYDRGMGPGYSRPYGRDPRDEDRRDGGKGRGGAAFGTKLYVGNLPADIAREALDMVFRTYGRVVDIHVMTGRAKNGQSCAFVTYSTPGEARTAISAMQAGYEISPGEGNIIVKQADEPKGEKGRGGDRSRPY
mmetsp:Transcript_73377/g.170221  ORF Transcript_73377/g.170221 Transcript_73377/m.170221 type:complete len:333 (-) Transcript_73377:208-1206(-)|eukprot:CAMPEP_0171098882 /NCGR_PEP_ID=MMETSP0766_2-20121228/49754_1 /TAXON_ID=439317 /ORGANISM="Gambierdiscus australes, Strain CAWD 149" /LENGTH=332 /DNA_ID=CAMNT_0011558353 /DNA_START=28 /DNA_END=1026 /DNA_ORIENTATION=-